MLITNSQLASLVHMYCRLIRAWDLWHFFSAAGIMRLAKRILSYCDTDDVRYVDMNHSLKVKIERVVEGCVQISFVNHSMQRVAMPGNIRMVRCDGLENCELGLDCYLIFYHDCCTLYVDNTRFIEINDKGQRQFFAPSTADILCIWWHVQEALQSTVRYTCLVIGNVISWFSFRTTAKYPCSYERTRSGTCYLRKIPVVNRSRSKTCLFCVLLHFFLIFSGHHQIASCELHCHGWQACGHP